jgi:TonB family protein
MKYTIAVLLVVLLVFAGCAVTQQIEVPAEQVELISATPLPPLKSISYAGGVKLSLLLHVVQDGTIESAKMLGSSGDDQWDSLALRSIKQWRFSAPRRDSVPTDVWVRQPVIVQVQEPIVMTVGELISADLHEADSLYALLEKGHALDTLFKHTPGAVDIFIYPQRVRDQLKKLREGEITRPLRVGDKYVIYKRLPKNVS